MRLRTGSALYERSCPGDRRSSPGTLQLNTIVLLLPGSVLMFDDASADFSVRFGAFSPDLFGEAGFRLGLSFFSFLKENPISQVNERMAAGLSTWFEIMDYTYQDRGNMFRKTIVRNRLQNIMLELYDKIQRKVSSQCPTTSNRQMELFHRFVSLVHDCCIEEREVSFYADKLCISTRYLSAIVRRTTHQSAKELIDKIVIMEIKVLLQNTTLPIQEIAYKMHFPDQSYLGRYFKKHTGISPSAFRQESR